MKPAFYKFLALFLACGLAATRVVALPTPPQGPNPALRREVRDYLKTSVLPVLRQQRQKLEAELAPPDQALLATYRTQLGALRQRTQALRQSARAARVQPGSPTPDSAAARGRARRPQSPALQAAQVERRTIMRHVAKLALKYQPNITRLAAEIQPQQTQWAADIKVIVSKGVPAEEQARLTHVRARAGRFSDLRKLLEASQFLLLAPSAGAAAPASPTPATSLYPNPVTAASQLQYEVKTAGPVTVELLDATSRPLRAVVPATTQAAGSYSQAIDLSDLPSGTYYYKVTTRAGTETKRFVKE